MGIILNKIEKSSKLNLFDIVKFQINMHTHFKGINISNSDLDCLTLLGINNKAEFTHFCNAACKFDERTKDHNLKFEREIFKSPQTVRNSVNKLNNIGLIKREKKNIELNPDIGIESSGNIFIQIKLLRTESVNETSKA